MDDITVIDDFLSKDELTFVDNFFENANWNYGLANVESDTVSWFKCELFKEPFFAKHILSKIKKVTNCDWECYDIHANGQTIQLEGKTHVDSKQPEDRWSALLYVSNITQLNIDKVNGHTEFKINKRVISIEPFKNRLVLFRSNIPHKGRAPSVPEIFRISIIFKLKKKI